MLDLLTILVQERIQEPMQELRSTLVTILVYDMVLQHT